MTEFFLRVLVTKENGQWGLQCLEYDLAAQGLTFEDAKSVLERTFISKVIMNLGAGREPMAGIPASPKCVVDAFFGAEDFGHGVTFDPLGVTIGRHGVRAMVTQFRIA